MIAGFELVFEPVGADPHAAGRRAATRALTSFGATLAYDGTRPIARRQPDGQAATGADRPRPGSNNVRPDIGYGPHFADGPHVAPRARPAPNVTSGRQNLRAAVITSDFKFERQARPGSNSVRPVNGVGPHFSDVAVSQLPDGHRLPDVAVSIAHAGSRAVAIAGPAAALGIDIVPDADIDRIARLAPRYLAAELSIATTPHALAACFAAKEAGLKALGLGLLDGGMFDTCVVTVRSLDPPLLDPADLALVIARIPGATIAVAYRIADAPARSVGGAPLRI